jgi:hypothetical protein
VLKDKEQTQFGVYRTRRLMLEAWDRWERETGECEMWQHRCHRDEIGFGYSMGNRKCA